MTATQSTPNPRPVGGNGTLIGWRLRGGQAIYPAEPAPTINPERYEAVYVARRPPRLLDLFCGGGGCSVGYHRAGFEVVGVDIEPQPDYPFEFHQADAMTYPLDGFDAIHASPPCKRFTTLSVLHDVDHPDLLTPTRERLEASGVPWVIENVPGAPMRPDVLLCGSQFDLGVRRHRWFELSWPLFELMPACQHDRETVCVVGHGGGSGKGTKVKRWTKQMGAEAMGIDWMGRDRLSQAIPPAYTEWIGHRLMEQLAVAA